MTHKRAFSLFLALLAITVLKANPVDMQTARDVAVKFVNANAKMPLRSVDDLQLLTTYRTENGEDAFHIFNTPNGFVIVSADDCATPILGYSEESRFDPDNIPIQLQDYLQVFVEQIQYGIENHVEDEAVAQQWQLVKATGYLTENRDGEKVEPLVTAKWGSGCYYNAMCPETEDGECGHADVGTVATAMGMVMHYWGYPKHGFRQHTDDNQWGFPTQFASFIDTEYDWANMPDSLTENSPQECIDAVATLLWHCGVAVDKDYGWPYIGDYGYYCINALTNYFNYSTEMDITDNVNNEHWLEDIKANLLLSRPVLIKGAEENLRFRFFVCDGFNNSDMLHLNWGWNGLGNGYFSVGAIYFLNYHFDLKNWFHYIFLNIFPKCDCNEAFAVDVFSNDSMMGHVTGGGTFECSEFCEVNAIPEEGYQFDYWSVNGGYASPHANYKFVVTSDCLLEAHFSAKSVSVMASTNPMKGGEISGVSSMGVLSYDNGIFGGTYHFLGDKCSFTWGVMFPTTLLEPVDGMWLSEIPFYSYELHDGIVSIYKGGDNAPRNLVYQQCYSTSVEGDFESIPLINPVQVDCNENLWIVFHNYTGNYAISQSTNLDDLNGVWFNQYGNWYHWGGTWMIRGCFSSSEPTPQTGTYWKGSFQENETCTVTASTNEGCYFLNWTEDGEIVSVDETYTFVVTDNRNLSANFSCTIKATAYPAEGGTISGEGVYPAGETCTLIAEANENYTFCYWTENDEIVSWDSEYSFPVTEARNIQAVFALPFSITSSLNIDNSGVLEGLGMYNYGDTCTVIAHPNDGFKFYKWVENGVVITQNEEYSFTVTSDVDLVAYFLPEETPTCDIVFNSWFFWQNCYLMVDYNDGTIDTIINETFYRKIIEGSHIVLEFKIDSAAPSWVNIPSFSVSYLDGTPLWSCEQLDHDSHYEFYPNCNGLLPPCEISAEPNLPEGGTVSGAGLYEINTTATVTANSNEGYFFMYWTEDGTVVSMDATYSFFVDKNRNLVANFKEDGIIDFADWRVKDCLVAFGNWIGWGNMDFELSYSEAARFTGFGSIFWGNNSIVAFDELQYFIGRTIIREFEFSEAGNLTTITLPITVTFINDSAFYRCTSLTKLTVLAKNPPKLGMDVFNGVNPEIPVFVPCGSEDEYRSINWGGFSNFIGICEKEISATAYPIDGGMVEGAGTHLGGSTCTLTATPTEGYSFINWTKNGIVVSTDETYNFLVIEDGSYVANFELNSYVIEATTSPADGGTITGTGTYHHGETVTMSVVPKQDFVFLSWTENNNIVSNETSFTLTVTGNHTFIANLSFNSVNETDNSHTMVYPNPAHDKLFVESEQHIFSCELMTIDGSVTCRFKDNTTKMEIPLNALTSGVYLVKITTEEYVLTRRFVKE